MGCPTGNCGKNSKNIAGNRVKPQKTKPANNGPSAIGTGAKTTVIRNGKVISRS